MHFHVADAHHNASIEAAHVLVAGLESDHFLDHEAGDAHDVDASAAPAGAAYKTMPALVIVAFIGAALLLWLQSVPAQFPWAPQRPPRWRIRRELLPPSQGPPLAA